MTQLLLKNASNINKNVQKTIKKIYTNIKNNTFFFIINLKDKFKITKLPYIK